MGIIVSNILVLMITKLQGLSLNSEVELFQILKSDEHNGLVKSLIGLNHFIVFIICPLIFVYFFYKNEAKEYLSLKHFNPSLLLFFPIALFSLYPLMGFLTFYIQEIDFPQFLKKLDSDSIEALSHLLSMNSFSDLINNILLIGILPGIGEELLFRGIIQKEITTKLKNPHIAIFITALIFGIFHFQVTGFLPKFIIGMVLGYAYYFSKSLILPMILHVINNSFATISFYFAGDIVQKTQPIPENIPLISVVISTFIFAVLMYQISNISKNEIQLDE